MSTIYGHRNDVKALYPLRDNGFVSVSRDCSTKIWKYNGKNEYVESSVYEAHTKYVNSVTVTYDVLDYPHGLIITGSNDQTIGIYDIKEGKVIANLSDHNGSVCTLRCKEAILYSGSFDCSMKAWNLNELSSNGSSLKPFCSIKGHDQAVWSVLPLPDRNQVLTASADKSIKLWNIANQQCLQTFKGHTDCVRGLTLTSNSETFLSCSNDGSAILWTLNESTALQIIPLTTSFLYSICTINSELGLYFATSGEDRTIRISSPDLDSPLQSIILPCQSLWNCICLQNNDLAVACNDGSIRLFTQDDKRQASVSEREEFERELSSFAISTKADDKVQSVDRSKLPGIEALSIPGNKDGQFLLINNNNEAEVYSWNSLDSRWIKIGVAMDSPDDSSPKKVLFEGKEYDYVFNIELDDVPDRPSLKLPYNNGDDPYFVAQQFIYKHELRQDSLDEIAQFIIQNTQQNVPQTTNSTYVDPFTGEGRYVPPSNGNTNVSHNQPSSSSRTYSTNSNITGGFYDPFTGSSAQEEQKNEYFPQKTFVLFDQKNYQPILNKIKEISNKYSNSERIMGFLNTFNEKNVSPDSIDLIVQTIQSWNKQDIFPLIDLLRIFVTLSQIQKHLIENNLYESLFNFVSNLIDQDSIVNSMLATRVICNLFALFNNDFYPISVLLFERKDRLLTHLIKCVDNSNNNKNIQISFATLILNYTILLNKVSTDDNAKTEYLYFLSGECDTWSNWDGEALFRILVAFGTLLNDSQSLVRKAKSITNFKAFLQRTNKQQSLDKVNLCLNFVMKLL